MNKEFEEVFKQQNFKLELSPNEEKKFISFQDARHFVQSEIEFWSSLDRSRGFYPDPIAQFNRIEHSLAHAEKANNENDFLKHINEASNIAKNNRHFLVYSKSNIADLITEVEQIDENEAKAIYRYLITQERHGFNIDISNKSFFRGLIRAYNYIDLDETFKMKINTKRKNIEKLRSEIEKTNDSVKQEYDIFVDDIKKQQTEFEDEYCKLKDQAKLDFKEQKDSQKKSFDEVLANCETKITENETLFCEKLRLEKPAKYWKEMSTYYKDKGKLWRCWSIISSSLLIIFLTILLYNFPSVFTTDEGKWTPEIFKATIILTVIISIWIYLIRFFIKLSTSAYHLQRDSKERFQLTHVYLALIKDSAIEKDDRDIVLQALFSRADTGLLKGDSGSPKSFIPSWMNIIRSQD